MSARRGARPAREIAGRSPHAVRAAKRLLDLAGRTGLAAGFSAEQEEIRALIGSPNQVEAVTARFEGYDVFRATGGS